MSIPGYDYPASYDDEDYNEIEEPDPNIVTGKQIGRAHV